MGCNLCLGYIPIFSGSWAGASFGTTRYSGTAPSCRKAFCGNTWSPWPVRCIMVLKQFENTELKSSFLPQEVMGEKDGPSNLNYDPLVSNYNHGLDCNTSHQSLTIESTCLPFPFCIIKYLVTSSDSLELTLSLFSLSREKVVLLAPLAQLVLVVLL